jgi:hypothetical protein
LTTAAQVNELAGSGAIAIGLEVRPDFAFVNLVVDTVLSH